MSLVLDSGSTTRLHCPVCATVKVAIQQVAVQSIQDPSREAVLDPTSGHFKVNQAPATPESGVTLLLACANDHTSALRFAFSALDMATSVRSDPSA